MVTYKKVKSRGRRVVADKTQKSAAEVMKTAPQKDTPQLIALTYKKQPAGKMNLAKCFFRTRYLIYPITGILSPSPADASRLWSVSRRITKRWEEQIDLMVAINTEWPRITEFLITNFGAFKLPINPTIQSVQQHTDGLNAWASQQLEPPAPDTEAEDEFSYPAQFKKGDPDG